MTAGFARAVRRVGESAGDAVLSRLGRAAARLHERRGLPADVLESDDAYLVVFDAPGADRDDVAVRCDGGTVGVRVERYREPSEGFTMRFPGRGLSLVGVVDLPAEAAVDAEAASADLTREGELHVTLPKVGAGGAAEEGSEVDETDVDDDEGDGA